MFGPTKIAYFYLLWFHFFVGLNIFAQSNLVINGALSASIDTNLMGVAKYFNEVKYVAIEGWEHNTCQQFYAPSYSINQGSFLTLNLHTAVGDHDFRVTNVSGKLCKPLLKGNTYLVEFYVKPFDVSHFYSGISVQFLDSIPPSQYYFKYEDFSKKCNAVSASSYVHNGYVTDTVNYTRISFTYKAKGGESVIYIYNSQPLCGKALKIKEPFNLFDDEKHAAYSYSKWCIYAVSSVNVISITDSSEACDKRVNVSDIANTTNSVKNNFVFRYDLDTDIPNERSMLDTLCNLLDEIQFKKIKIIGHTDGTGDKKYNKQLSDKRANYVANFVRKCTKAQIFIESVADEIRIEDKVKSAINRRVEVFIE